MFTSHLPSHTLNHSNNGGWYPEEAFNSNVADRQWVSRYLHGSLIPRLPCSGTGRCIHGDSLVSFLTWPWCNQNRTRVFRTERQRFACLFDQLCIQQSVCMIFNPQQLDTCTCTCSKLPATFAFFPVLSRGYAHAQWRSPTPSLPWTLFTWQKLPSSPRLHNFNVRILGHGSLGTRLLTWEWCPCV